MFWQVVAYVLYLYLLLLVLRIVFETTRQFARAWRPAGVAAIGIEMIYSATDPPVRAMRRLVRPVRVGPIALDLSMIILFLAILAFRFIALTLASV